MVSPRHRGPAARVPRGRRRVLWACLILGGLLPSVGCQVDYAGMTLPSGKYMYDDVQYFKPGPHFPWANTQAATQRARMARLGYELPDTEGAGPQVPPVAEGALDPTQNVPNMPTNANVFQDVPQNVPPPPPPAFQPPQAPPGGPQ